MLDKEKLIEHFKNKDARNVAIKISGGDIDIVDGILGGDLWLSHGASMDMDNCFERLTTKRRVPEIVSRKQQNVKLTILCPNNSCLN